MLKQKIQMSKRKFRIGELAQELKVKKFVIRFWEKEFELKSDRSGGGQRFYDQGDLQTFSIIKDLLYNQKFTIPGAKKQLQTLLNAGTSNISPATKISSEEIEQIPETPTPKKEAGASKEFLEKLQVIKQKLVKLKNSLS